MNFKTIALYARTLKYLRVEQILGQLRVRFCGLPMNFSKIEKGSFVVGYKGVCERQKIPPPVPPQCADAISRGVFEFIGKEENLGQPINWSSPQSSKLWRYNLHYFDWLWSLLVHEKPAVATAVEMTSSWIDDYASASDNRSFQCGWEPYPMSLRLINWALLFGVRFRSDVDQYSEFHDKLKNQIRTQSEWLASHLEIHLQANHLFENLAALICVTSIYDWDRSDQIREKVLSRFRKEMREQILDDGMHYERSPMYHLRMLWIIEMLKSIGDAEVNRVIDGVGLKMQEALDQVRHPDGSICQFNDASQGIYYDAWREHHMPDRGAWALEQAGYYGSWKGGDGVIIDVASIGPNHQPGHAHADFFSFEMSLSGKKIITDTGVSSYEIGAGRNYDRSTAAHSTVEVNGENSVEVWSGFRVGRRATPRILKWEPQGNEFLLEAEHYGYHHLACKAVHRRRYVWNGNELHLFDKVELVEASHIVSRIHLAPGVIARLKERCVECALDDVKFLITLPKHADCQIVESVCYPYFGQAEDRSVVEIRMKVDPPYREWLCKIIRVNEDIGLAS